MTPCAGPTGSTCATAAHPADERIRVLRKLPALATAALVAAGLVAGSTVAASAATSSGTSTASTAGVKPAANRSGLPWASGVFIPGDSLRSIDLLRRVARGRHGRHGHVAGTQQLERRHQLDLALRPVQEHVADPRPRPPAVPGERRRDDGRLRPRRLRRQVADVRDHDQELRRLAPHGDPPGVGVQRQLVQVVGQEPGAVRRLLAARAEGRGVHRAGPALGLERQPRPVAAGDRRPQGVPG